ncbi:MAG: hypothetical protein AAF304_07780 [Pseudomonadota bacterium]
MSIILYLLLYRLVADHPPAVSDKNAKLHQQTNTLQAFAQAICDYN